MSVNAGLKRLQVLGQVGDLAFGEAEPEMRVVVVDHVGQRCKPSVVIKAAFRVCPQSSKRGCSVVPIGRAIGLEVVDADLLGRCASASPAQ